MDMDGQLGMPYPQQQQPPFLAGGDYPSSGAAPPHQHGFDLQSQMQQGGGEQWTPCPVTVRLVRKP